MFCLPVLPASVTGAHMESVTLHSTVPPAFMSNATSRPLSSRGHRLLAYSATRESLRAEHSMDVAHHL